MSSAEEFSALLKAKQQELDALQESYDDYIQSSKELEIELEGALQHTEAQLSDCSKKKAALEEKVSTLQDKYSQLARELSQIQTECHKSQEKLKNVEQIKVTLEQHNDDLQEKLRIALATEDDLKDKLHRTEEESIFLQSEIDEIRHEKMETERRLKEELTELHAELANLSSLQERAAEAAASAESGEIPKRQDSTDQMDIIEALELEVADLTEKLTEAEEQSRELSDELSRVQEELMQSSNAGEANLSSTLSSYEGKIKKLEADMDTLNEKLGLKEAELFAILEEQKSRDAVDEKNKLVIQQLTEQLSLKSAELEAVKLRLVDTEADLKAKEQLITGLEKRIEKIEAQREEAEKNRTELSAALEDMKEKEATRRERWILEQERLKLQEAAAMGSPVKPNDADEQSVKLADDLKLVAPKTPREDDLLADTDGLADANQVDSTAAVGPSDSDQAGNGNQTPVGHNEDLSVDESGSLAKGEGDVEQLSNFDQEMKSWETERLMLLRRINELTQELHLRRHHNNHSQSTPSRSLSHHHDSFSDAASSSVEGTEGGRGIFTPLKVSTSVGTDSPNILYNTPPPPPPPPRTPTADATVNTDRDMKEVEDSIKAIALIDASSAQLAVQKALSSQDVAMVRSELLKQTDRLEKIRMSNAVLLQKLQALKGNIQVCCRSRPPNDMEINYGGTICVEAIDDCELACHDKRFGSWRSFAFDKVWPSDATQAEVFSDVEPLALSVVDGYNACILAYGQTGSGKTYTMNGYGKDVGVSYRTLNKIFELLALKQSKADRLASKMQAATVVNGKKRTGSDADSASHKALSNGHESSMTDSSTMDGKDQLSGSDGVSESGDEGDVMSAPPFSYTVEVSMLEIYNEQIKDLLSPSDNPNNSLDARQTQEGSVYVPGLTQETVNTLEEVIDVFKRGSENRATAATNLNEHSSRSHSLLMVTVTSSTNGSPPMKGKLYLVDLAGSERVDKSGATGTTMKEAQHINKSLSALGDVMEALDSRSKHVPFRNSKLTYLLQDSLGGNSRTMMIVTVCPTEMSIDETLFTLQFATRVRRINLGAARRNVTAKNLEEALKAAKLELKETKKRKTQLEEHIAEMKRDQKRSQEKITAQMDARVRSIDEVRKGVEAQISTLHRANSELTTKLTEEREARQQQTVDMETLQRNLKKTQELLRIATKEKEDLVFSAKQKQKDLDTLRAHVRELEKEKDKDKNYVASNRRVAPITTPKSTSKSLEASDKPDAYPNASSSFKIVGTTGKATTNVVPQRPAPPRLKTPTKRLEKAPSISDMDSFDKMIDDGDSFIVNDDNGPDDVYLIMDSMTAAANSIHSLPSASRSLSGRQSGHTTNTNTTSSTVVNSTTGPSASAGGGGGGGGALTRAEAAVIRHQERMKKRMDSKK